MEVCRISFCRYALITNSGNVTTLLYSFMVLWLVWNSRNVTGILGDTSKCYSCVFFSPFPLKCQSNFPRVFPSLCNATGNPIFDQIVNGTKKNVYSVC